MGLQLENVHILMAALACWRLTDLVTIDRITERLREAYPFYLWTCPRCVSVWAGAAVTAFYVFCPWLNWALAFSWLVISCRETLKARASRRIVIQLDPDRGLLQFPSSPYTSSEMIVLLRGVIDRIQVKS